jgi:hypothetical protein
MEQRNEEAKLGDYPLIRERLELISREKSQAFKALARHYGVRPGNEEEVIQDTFVKMLTLAPQGKIQELLTLWEETVQNLARLDQNLTALFVFFLRLNARRREPREPASVPDPVVNPYPQLEALLTLEQIDCAVKKMYGEKVVNEMEWDYWCWLRNHMEGRVADFAESLDDPRKPGGWIKRTRRSLFEKIAKRIGADPPRQVSSSRSSG